MNAALTGRMSRLEYTAAMAVVLIGFLGLVGYLGLEYGLKNTLLVFTVVSIVALVLRVLVAAARWRDAGLPGWPLAIATTLAGAGGFFLAPPSVALPLFAAILMVESALPRR